MMQKSSNWKRSMFMSIVRRVNVGLQFTLPSYEVPSNGDFLNVLQMSDLQGPQPYAKRQTPNADTQSSFAGRVTLIAHHSEASVSLALTEYHGQYRLAQP
ncbi:hypothetical protein Q7P35_010971 [Cladosporium inversicolor]